MGGPGRRGLLPGVVAQMTRHGARRHSSAPAQGETSDVSRVLATARGSRGPCEGQTRPPPVIFRGPGGLFTEDRGHRNPGASGSPNRWLRPESVRHMSVTTAMQGLTAAHHDTRRDSSNKAREAGNTQLTGRFRRWWQVLGSNQRRLSRRFYRPIDLVAHMPLDLRLHGRLPDYGSCPSAICPCARGSGRTKSRVGPDGVRVGPLPAPLPRPGRALYPCLSEDIAVHGPEGDNDHSTGHACPRQTRPAPPARLAAATGLADRRTPRLPSSLRPAIPARLPPLSARRGVLDDASYGRGYRRLRSKPSQNPRCSACLTSSCCSDSTGRSEPCNRRACRSDGIRGFPAMSASSHGAGAARATAAPNANPSTWPAWTASLRGIIACCGVNDSGVREFRVSAGAPGPACGRLSRPGACLGPPYI